MSSVRMCDRCGTIFSENAEDWSTFTGTRRTRDEASNRYRYEEITQDACPDCTRKVYGGETPAPRTAIATSKVTGDATA